MRTIEKQIYAFDELSDSAKENAREFFRINVDFPWNSECQDSIETFCAEFGVKLDDYRVDPFGHYSYKTDVDNSTFRGMKLSKFDRESMPTGYCMDSTLRYTFADEWKRTGDPLASFDSALDAAFKEWREDMEYQYTDEAIDELIKINEYEFYETGKIYN